MKKAFSSWPTKHQTIGLADVIVPDLGAVVLSLGERCERIGQNMVLTMAEEKIAALPGTWTPEQIE